MESLLRHHYPALFCLPKRFSGKHIVSIMVEPSPFRPDKAKDAIEGDGDFLLPICLPEPDVMIGEDIAIIVLTTAEDQRVGIPVGMQALSDLHEIIGEALRRMQAGEGNTVQ